MNACHVCLIFVFKTAHSLYFFGYFIFFICFTYVITLAFGHQLLPLF